MRSRLTVRYHHNTLSNAFKYWQSFVHQNNLLIITNTMRLYFCISDGERQVFHGDMIIVIRVFAYSFYNC